MIENVGLNNGSIFDPKTKEEAYQTLEYCEAYERLKNNDDFKLIMDYYLNHDTLRLVGLKTFLQSVYPKSTEEIKLKEKTFLNQLEAKSDLNNFFNQLEKFGESLKYHIDNGNFDTKEDVNNQILEEAYKETEEDDEE